MASKKTTPAAKSTTAASSPTPTTPLPFAPRLPARPFVDPNATSKSQTPATPAAVQANYQAPDKQSTSNVLGDPTQNLQKFLLTDLAQYTKEASFSSIASKDVHLFYVGRDDVHDILKYILSRVTISLYLNMFGFDDAELNNIIMEKALNPGVTMLITLDQSQAGGVHEKALLEADQQYNLAAYNTHFVIGQSATHQISHTKGFVADGKVACEGSTNWSTGGEGTFVVSGQPGGKGYIAQNNTQSVITDPDTIVRFQTELIAEHMIARSVVQGIKPAADAKPLMNKPVTEAPTAPSPAATAAATPTAAAPAPAKAAAKKAATPAPAKTAAPTKAPARKSPGK